LNVSVYGFMGVGKTTIGGLLAERLDYRFVDMDAEIERRVCKKITDIFADYGETYFRELESALVKELSKSDGLVIACGGGTVADASNAEALKVSSRMVYLTASMDEIIKRTTVDDTRPLLEVSDPESTALRLFEKRKPVYERYAEVTMDTTGQSPEMIVEEILEALG
jgi:shikimate kinase